jgi:hypothetical protein
MTTTPTEADVALAEVQAYCGWHIAPSKTEDVQLDGTSSTVLRLPTLHLTELNSLTIDDQLVDVDDISAVEWSVSGWLRRQAGFGVRLRGVVVNITHGYDDDAARRAGCARSHHEARRRDEQRVSSALAGRRCAVRRGRRRAAQRAADRRVERCSARSVQAPAEAVMTLSLGPHTIDIVRPAERSSDYGTRPELDWTNATTTTVSGCNVQPVAAAEFTQDRDSTMTRWVAWLPAEADVHATDRIVWTGETYDVDGDVERWDFGALSHQVINLRRSEG